jgi:hypothetical protein
MRFRSTSRITLLVLISSCIPFHFAAADIYVVHPDGSGDFATIQEAVDASVAGDEIELGNGVFSGNGNFNIALVNKVITIRSQSDDPNQCIIDCNGGRGEDARGFSNSASDPLGPLIQGITIRHGIAEAGGGIMTNGTLRLNNCKFLENEANFGGAIYVFQPDAPKRGLLPIVIENCDFISNFASTEGGAIAQVHFFTGLTINDCRFLKNTTLQFGGAVYALPPIDVNGTIFARNEAGDAGGAAVCINGGTFNECTLALNIAARGSAIFYGAPIHGTPNRGRGLVLTVANTIIAFGERGDPVSCEDTALQVFTCCDIYGNSAGDWVGCLEGLDQTNGNFSLDPLFCGFSFADPLLFGDRFTLSPSSPCLPFRGCGRIGARGVEECGREAGSMLRSSLPATTWGRIKGEYR